MRSMSARTRRIAIAVVAVAVLGGAGGAFAASQSSGPSRQALLDDAAKRLNVTPQQLQSALQGAAIDQVNAAVAAGRLTQAQADAIKQRIQNGGGPPLFGGRHAGMMVGPGRGLLGAGVQAAAQYLNLTPAQLKTQLASGRSLAQITASTPGKSVSGLEQAITAAVKSRLDAAVSANRITSAQEQQILSALAARLPNLVQRQFNGAPGPGGPGHPGFRMYRHGMAPGGPPVGAGGWY